MVDVIYIKPKASGMSVSYVDPEEETAEAMCTKFMTWLKTAAFNEKYCYYIGYHVAGNRVARLAYRAYESGSVILFQKKAGLKFEYWAQKRS